MCLQSLMSRILQRLGEIRSTADFKSKGSIQISVNKKNILSSQIPTGNISIIIMMSQNKNIYFLTGLFYSLGMTVLFIGHWTL